MPQRDGKKRRAEVRPLRFRKCLPLWESAGPLRCDASVAREGFYGILDGEHVLRSLGRDKRPNRTYEVLLHISGSSTH